jgi:hypothetical protein
MSLVHTRRRTHTHTHTQHTHSLCLSLSLTHTHTYRRTIHTNNFNGKNLHHRKHKYALSHIHSLSCTLSRRFYNHHYCYPLSLLLRHLHIHYYFHIHHYNNITGTSRRHCSSCRRQRRRRCGRRDPCTASPSPCTHCSCATSLYSPGDDKHRSHCGPLHPWCVGTGCESTPPRGASTARPGLQRRAGCAGDVPEGDRVVVVVSGGR